MNKFDVMYLTGGLVVGGVVGYFTTKLKLQKDYQVALEREIKLTEEHTAKSADFLDTSEGIKNMAAAMMRHEPDAQPEDPEVIAALEKIRDGEFLKEAIDLLKPYAAEKTDISNVWDRHGDDSPEEEEEVEITDAAPVVGTRLDGQPYIISVEEYDQKDEAYNHYDDLSFTYFEDDDTLTDDREQVVSDWLSSVGDQALANFGHLSGNKSLVYVRNEELEVDIEISLDRRSYSELVLGIGGPSTKRPKFRAED